MYGTGKLARHVELGPDDVEGAVPLQGIALHLHRRIGACLEEGDGLGPFRWDPLVHRVSVQQPFEDEARLIRSQVVQAVHVDGRGIGSISSVQDVGGGHFQVPYLDGQGDVFNERET